MQNINNTLSKLRLYTMFLHVRFTRHLIRDVKPVLGHDIITGGSLGAYGWTPFVVLGSSQQKPSGSIKKPISNRPVLSGWTGQAARFEVKTGSCSFQRSWWSGLPKQVTWFKELGASGLKSSSTARP